MALRAKCIYDSGLTQLHCWTDRLFIGLLLLQWVAGMLIALILSPRTWDGPASAVHPHVWSAIILGGILSLFPSYLAVVRPGTIPARYVIAVAQMLWSALLIHLTGGRIESHFHIFGSLAFLAFYRDWRVLSAATGVVVVDHLLIGIYWPQSIYGITTSGLWRTVEHGFWVVFEDAFLLISIYQSHEQSWSIATKQALLEQQHSGEIEAKNIALEQANELLVSTNHSLHRQISERNEAVRALSESEGRYRRIVELSPFAILLVRRNRIVFVNPPCVTLFKARDPCHFADKSLADLFHPDHRAWITESLLANAADLTLLPQEALSLCFDGTTKDVEVSAFSFQDNGEINTQVIVHDIAIRKQLESQSRQAQKMEVTGQLAGGIAHDFNNLLSVILGSCQFLGSDASLSSDNQALVEDIFTAGSRAAHLTRQLLAYSRQQVLQPAVLNLNDVVIETGNMLERLIGEDIILTSNLTPNLWSVKADAVQVQQVIMNLAVNARDAMPQGGNLTIETTNVELDESYSHSHPDLKPGFYAVLSVSDNGSGMDERTVSRMFEPFFTTKGVGKGTGLGLATVFGIIKQSGGHITVESELDRGTTFRVYLPRVEQEVGHVVEQPQRAPVRGTETVLIVEDEDGVRNLASRILTSQGYTVLKARNGIEALRIFQEHQREIELVLTDVVMPEMSGRILQERLLAMQPNLALLFMSGYTDDAVVRHGILESEKNFIQKPFSCAALANAVRSALDERTSEADDCIADQLSA